MSKGEGTAFPCRIPVNKWGRSYGKRKSPHGRCQSKQLFPARTTIQRYSTSWQRRRGKGMSVQSTPQEGRVMTRGQQGHPSGETCPVAKAHVTRDGTDGIQRLGSFTLNTRRGSKEKDEERHILQTESTSKLEWLPQYQTRQM